jgi:p-hydroxybenzoate 3-monooxygenase
VHDIGGAQSSITWTCKGEAHRARCDFIAGCDGFHGVWRASLPQGAATEYELV